MHSLNSLIALLMPLQVCIPLLFGVILLFIRSGNLSHIITSCCLLIVLVISILLLISLNISNQDSVSYVFGGFSRVIGIEYKLSKYSSILLILVSFISFISFVWGRKLLKRELFNNKIYIFNALFLFFCSGILGVILAFDLFNIFVFLEISAISSYALIAMNEKCKESSLASFNYLIIGSIASSLYVLGVGIIYMITGSLNMEIAFSKLGHMGGSPIIVLALILILIFTLIKSGSFPFSSWVQSVYRTSPSTFSVMVASVGSKVIFFAFFKVILTLAGTLTLHQFKMLEIALISIGLLSIVVGTTLAIFKDNLKDIFAWSAVSDTGYILLLCSTLSKDILPILLLITCGYAITKAGLFMVIGNINYQTKHTNIKYLGNYSKSNYLNFLIFMIFGLITISFPGTIGFAIKWFAINSLLQKYMLVTAGIFVITSSTSIIYIWRIVEVFTFNKPILLKLKSKVKNTKLEKAPFNMMLLTFVISIISIFVGLMSEYIVAYLK